MTSVRLSDEAISAIGAAVFDKPDALVLEAYSEFDKPPQQFHSAQSLVEYIKARLAHPHTSAFFFVIYPDMRGRAVRTTIHLDPAKVPGHSIRYTWGGWGLISVIVENRDGPNRGSRVSANTEKRAENWASTYVEWDLPATWNWKAVASHARRLQRVVKASLKSAGQTDCDDACTDP